MSVSIAALSVYVVIMCTWCRCELLRSSQASRFGYSAFFLPPLVVKQSSPLVVDVRSQHHRYPLPNVNGAGMQGFDTRKGKPQDCTGQALKVEGAVVCCEVRYPHHREDANTGKTSEAGAADLSVTSAPYFQPAPFHLLASISRLVWLSLPDI